MRLSFGKGGWVGVDDAGLAARVYVRFAPDRDGRLTVREAYLDGSAAADGLSQREVRELPLSRIEALVNGHAAEVLATIDEPSPDLSTYASYYRTTFVRIDPADWVAVSFAAQVDRSRGPARTRVRSDAPKFRRAKRVEHDWKVDEDKDFRMTGGPSEGLTDDFLRDVARAYRAAVARGERPNVAIAAQTGYPLKTVQRWVYTARNRRIMPRGAKGQVG